MRYWMSFVLFLVVFWLIDHATNGITVTIDGTSHTFKLTGGTK